MHQFIVIIICYIQKLVLVEPKTSESNATKNALSAYEIPSLRMLIKMFSYIIDDMSTKRKKSLDSGKVSNMTTFLPIAPKPLILT